MAEKKEGAVTLVAPNGVTVSVAESKEGERLATGYQLPDLHRESKPSRSSKK